MKLERIKQLAGLSEDATSKVPLGLVFTLSDQSNMRKAIDAILEAGMNVDLSFSMGTYYFKFDSEAQAEEAQAIVAKVIDKKKEQS